MNKNRCFVLDEDFKNELKTYLYEIEYLQSGIIKQSKRYRSIKSVVIQDEIIATVGKCIGLFKSRFGEFLEGD